MMRSRWIHLGYKATLKANVHLRQKSLLRCQVATTSLRLTRLPRSAVFLSAGAFAVGLSSSGNANDLPYTKARAGADQALIALRSQRDSIRVAAAENLIHMLGQPGLIATAAADATESLLGTDLTQLTNHSASQDWVSVVAHVERALNSQLRYADSAKAESLNLGFVAESEEEVEADLDRGRWFQIVVPAAGRLASRPSECPAVWAAYRGTNKPAGLERLPYTRANAITEMFFPSAGSYLVRIDHLSDCNSVRFATEWSPGVTYVGAPTKKQPLARSAPSVSTVTIPAGRSAWFTVNISDRERMTVETTRLRMGADTVLEAYRAGQTMAVLADDDSGSGDRAAWLDLALLQPGAYHIRAGELHAASASFDVVFASDPIHKIAPGAHAAELKEGESIWLSLSAKADHSYQLVTQDLSKGVDTYVAVYRHGETAAVAENDDASDNILASEVSWDVSAEGDYLIEIKGPSGEPGRFRYTLSELPTPIGNCATPATGHEPVITAANFDEAVGLSAGVPLVLVDFWAGWCIACRQLNPILRRIAREYCNSVRLITVDVDKETQLATRFQIDAVPVVLLYSYGRRLDAFMGARSAAEVRAFLHKHLSQDTAISRMY